MWEAPQVPNPETNPEMAPIFSGTGGLAPIIFPHMWDSAPEVPWHKCLPHSGGLCNTNGLGEATA